MPVTSPAWREWARVRAACDPDLLVIGANYGRDRVVLAEAPKSRGSDQRVAWNGPAKPASPQEHQSSRLDRLDEMPFAVERLVEQALIDTPAPEDMRGTPPSLLLEASGQATGDIGKQ